MVWDWIADDLNQDYRRHGIGLQTICIRITDGMGLDCTRLWSGLLAAWDLAGEGL
jgi:hypothetical protein